jgi:lipoic acid synthetase
VSHPRLSVSAPSASSAVSSPGGVNRLPPWARKGSPLAPGARELRVLLRGERLNTVCEEARCPNLGECFSRGTATFMLLGDRCTRRCGYCSVSTARPQPPDLGEPRRVAAAAARLGLRYVVLTAVARDDLWDGGAAHFASTVSEVRLHLPHARVEVLTPDFKGDRAALQSVLDAAPDVFNHNIETVPRLFPEVRPQGGYGRSLELLALAKELRPAQVTKSGFMVGLGESDGEVEAVLQDLRSVSVDIVTIGQYLRPTRDHLPVARYLTPEGFARLESHALRLGFPTVYAGVFVRSSFNAEEVFHGPASGAPRHPQ